MPQFILFSDLHRSSFKKQGIGSKNCCAKLFDSEQKAKDYAEALMETIKPKIVSSDFDAETMLDVFQEFLCSGESFQIVPLVE